MRLNLALLGEGHSLVDTDAVDYSQSKYIRALYIEERDAK